MKTKASNYYKQGFSCSESIVKAAIDANLCNKELLTVSTVFSSGMSSGCLCGAVAGAQLVLGCCYGLNNKYNNPEIAREKAREFINKFKAKRKTTCCRALTAGLEGTARRDNCNLLVEECAEILEDMVKIKV
jgi:C_GCAxxG_C_C family probable redox protein